MEDFFESLTRGNLTEVKVVLATVVLSLAVYQLALISVAYGKVRPRFLTSGAAGSAHRAVGDSIVVLSVVVALMCVSYFGFGEGGLHPVVACALLAALALKVALVRLGPSRLLPPLGGTVFVLFVLTWVTSAGDFLWDR